jgi:hypothetical protein
MCVDRSAFIQQDFVLVFAFLHEVDCRLAWRSHVGVIDHHDALVAKERLS